MISSEHKSNLRVVEGVNCRVIGGKELVTYREIARYTQQSVGTVKNKVYRLGLKTYRLGRFAALEKSDADSLVLGGDA